MPEPKEGNRGSTGLPADVIREHLASYLGPFTARNAVRMFSVNELKTEPERVTPAQVPQLLAAMGPMLRTLLGQASAERIAEELTREFRL